jgi:hypothetical protein
LSVVALINLGIALLQWLQREQEAAGKRSSDDAAPAGAAP